MKVYDLFNFFNEIETLRIRLEVLKDKVDYFCLTESTVTFSGKPKPLYFEENKHLFEDFKDRIIHNVVDDTPVTNISWEREIHQRNAMRRCVEGIVTDDAIILSGDVDEIPNLDGLYKWYDGKSLFHPLMDMYYYYLNNWREDNWFGTKVCSWEFMKNIPVDTLRNMKTTGYAVQKCGWHFSYIGGADRIRQKIDAFSDVDLNNPIILSNLENHINANTDIFFRGQKMTPVPIDESFPAYIRNNQEKYKHLIKEI